jgi:hypothetical protein
VVAAIALLPAARRERQRLLLLRNLIEQAAAPGETVLVDSLWLDRFLRWKGSPALRQQLLYTGSNQIPGEVLEPPQELVVVAFDHAPLLNALRAYGYVLTPDATQDNLNANGHVIALPFSGVLHIYFAAPPPATQPQPTQPPSNPPAVTP